MGRAGDGVHDRVLGPRDAGSLVASGRVWWNDDRQEGMNLAAHLAATAYDLFADPQLLKDANAEHKKRLDGRKYAAMLEKDQPPPLDYRNAGRGSKE